VESAFLRRLDMASMRGRHNRIKYFFIETVKSLFEQGYGKSKYEAFQRSYNEDRTRRSDVIHSFSTCVSYETTAAKFGDFLSEMGVKTERDFRKLSSDQVREYLDKYFEKQQQEGLAKKTLERQISALYKVLSAVNSNLKELFTSDNRMKWRNGLEPGDNDRYDNPTRVAEELRKINEVSHAVCQLQRLTGSRIGDVKKIKIDEQNQRILIERSKGGRNRFVYYDKFQREFEEVKKYKEVLDKALQERPFSEIRKEYYKDLRRACKRASEVYRGSHSFRFEWAQERYETISQLPREEQEQYYRKILEERGKPAKDVNKALENAREKNAVAEYVISEELGHSRLDISRHYLRIKAK
jgi:hypothetical protein